MANRFHVIATMKRYRQLILVLIAVFVVPLWAFGDPPVYFAKDIHGQVVDAETGKPLEGVVVVARWIFENIGFVEGHTGGTINTLEAVTDKEGKYYIPAWGPRPRWPLSYLSNLAPELRVFKPNYYPERVSNRLYSYVNHNRGTVRTSEWDGKVIKLKPFKGDDWIDYGFNKLNGFWSSESSDCVRACPHFVLALAAESERIKRLSPKGVFVPRLIDVENFSASNREFLKGFENEK